MRAAGPHINITSENIGILMASMKGGTPKPDPHNTQMCLSHALFLHSLPDGLLFLCPLFFAIVSALLTQFIRVVSGVHKPAPGTPATATTTTTTTAGDVESTAIPDPATTTVDVEAGQVQGEDPPPYTPPEPTAVPATATTTSAPEIPAKPAVKKSSAQLFVEGTALLIPMLFSILCLALSIQWMSFCPKGAPWSTTAQVFSWLFFFCGPAMWATNGVTCWAMLFRDLWGPATKKKYHFEEYAMAVGIVVVIMMPFMAIGMFFIKAVETAQRRWCGDALADEEGVEIGELSRADEVEADLQEVRVGGEEGEASEGDTQRHEETAGLIRGMEK